MTTHQVLNAVWGERVPEPLAMTRGRWTCELRGDEIAEIGYDQARVARAVRLVARDRDWNTVPIKIIGHSTTPSGRLLRLRTDDFGIRLEAELSVIMSGEQCRIELAARATADLLANRIGLVVLHQPELAGSELSVTTPAGSTRQAEFPIAIAPWQPATDIARLGWVRDGVQITTTFTGDVFEMEDQRNWTDASFKTYSRPLAQPFPYWIGAGEQIRQSVTFDVARDVSRAPAYPPGSVPEESAAEGPYLVELTDSGREVPAITLGASEIPDAGAGPIPDGVAAVLVELDTRTHWHRALAHAVAEAGRLPLDVRLVADDPGRVAELVRAAAAAAPVIRLGVFAADTHVSEPELWSALTRAASQYAPDAEIVGGSRAHYTELNRTHRRLPAELPSLAFAMTPQMHATERAQLVESIAMQQVVIRDAERIAAGRPLHVGPITLRPRFNDVATGDAVDADDRDRLTDPRQSAPAVEAWTVASFAAICAAGAPVGSVSYFEIAGARGLGTGDRPFPVARAIAALAGVSGDRLLVSGSALPPGWWVVGAARPDGSARVLAASLADHDHAVTLRIRRRSRPLTLEPYQVADLTID